MKKDSGCCAAETKDTAKCSFCHDSDENAGCCGGHDSTKKTLVLILICLPLLVLSYIGLQNIFGLHVLMYFDPALIVVALLGFPIARSAVSSIKNKEITSSVLITLAVIACLVLQIIVFVADTEHSHGHSYFFAAGEVVFLMRIGELIENFTVRRSKSGISKLVALMPQTARRVTGETEEIVNIDRIKVGDTVLVYANENITVDGVVTEGTSSVNQANLTGESLPVEKTAGDKVFASTYNSNGVLKIKVEKTAGESNISKIVEIVRAADGKEARISRLADKMASFIIPSAVIASVIVFVLALTAFKTDVITAIIRMVTVLVVFCPCALAIATPTAVAATIGRNSLNGVLIKNGTSLEVLSKTNAIVFDKTGTLTEGVLAVTDKTSYNDEYEWFEYAAALEKYSNHPIGIAIAGEGTKNFNVSDVQNKVGFGIKGKIDGHIVTVGKGKNAQADVYVDEKFCGSITLNDKIRHTVRDVIEELSHTYEIHMLTGDNELTAKNLAETAGIANYKANMLPLDKSTHIENLQARGKSVVMVGDGVNDSVSLTKANCGIAVAGLGSDLAIECADMVLLNGNIDRLPPLVKSSKRMMRTIIANITISLMISFTSIILSAFGMITPALGAIIHNASSVLVAANSACLLLGAKKKKTLKAGCL